MANHLILNKRVELKNSLDWIKSSFYVFRTAPVQLFTLTVLNILVSILPAFGAFLAPLFTARFAEVAMSVEKKQTIKFSRLFANLFANRSIVSLGMVNLTVSLLVLMLQYLLCYIFDTNSIMALIALHPWMVTVFVLPMILIQMALWLSPVICLNHSDISPFQAIKLSFKASVYNVVTLLCYSLLIIGFTLISIIPFGLGLIIWLPIVNINVYFIYKSLYLSKE